MNPYDKPYTFVLSIHRRPIPNQIADIFDVTLGGHDGSISTRIFEITPMENQKEVVANNLAGAFIELVEKAGILK